jgi:hypothetical protein
MNHYLKDTGIGFFIPLASQYVLNVVSMPGTCHCNVEYGVVHKKPAHLRIFNAHLSTKISQLFECALNTLKRR